MFHIKCKELAPLFKEVLQAMEEKIRPFEIHSVIKKQKKKIEIKKNKCMIPLIRSTFTVPETGTA